MIESDNGFSTYAGDYDEVLNDLSNLVGCLKLHNFAIPDITYAVGLGLTFEVVKPKNAEAKEVLNYIKGKKDAQKNKSITDSNGSKT